MKPEVKSAVQRMSELVDWLEVPAGRKQDYYWLSRNIGIRNQGNPYLAEAQQLIRGILRNG